MNPFELWYRLPIAVIDFETTSGDVRTCEPVEIAVVLLERGEPVHRFTSFLKPSRADAITPEAQAVHGISWDMVRDAPSPRDLFEIGDFIYGITGAVPCGYNGNAFDAPILRRMIAGYEYNELACSAQWPWIDPLIAIRDVDKYVKGSGRHKLAATCARRNIPLEQEHSALADAEATGRLLFSLQDYYGDCTITELLRRQRLRAAAQERAFAAWQAQQKAQGS